VAGVDRLLTRGHGLFPASGGEGGGVFAAGGGDAGAPVPPPPSGDSGLGAGAGGAGGVYKQAQSGAVGLDAESGQAADEGDAAGGQGRAGSGAVRDQARAQAAAIGPMSNSASGMRLMVSTMDERLAAMQRQIDTTTTQNQVLATRLRQVVEGYRGLSGMAGGSPLAGLSGLPMQGGSAGGGFGGLSSLAGIPGSLMSARWGSGAGGAASSTGFSDRSVGGGDLPPGVGSEKGLQKDTVLAERAVSAAFPEIGSIGGCRPDSLKWHPNGQAIDVMIPDPSSAHGKALGDSVLRFALQHRDAFNLNHVIWRQTLYNPDGSSELMENRGSPTQNHMDHVHIATNGGGYPRGGEVYRL